jgi:hypothetical protein
MEKHKFKVGDQVRVERNVPGSGVDRGTYKIIKALPVAGFGLQYRARNAADPHDVILDESAIRPING